MTLANLIESFVVKHFMELAFFGQVRYVNLVYWTYFWQLNLRVSYKVIEQRVYKVKLNELLLTFELKLNFGGCEMEEVG